MKDLARLEVRGVDELMKALDEIVSEDGPKGMNAALRKSTRKAAREITLPRVKELIPHDTGELESQLKVRAVKRARGKVGHTVGFPDPLFQGDTFYGGFLEFGFKHRGGSDVRPDSFLRRGLYENEAEVRRQVEDDLREFVRQANRRA